MPGHLCNRQYDSGDATTIPTKYLSVELPQTNGPPESPYVQILVFMSLRNIQKPGLLIKTYRKL